MRSRFAVGYGTCVLRPAPLRDSLMRLAPSDLYRARRSGSIGGMHKGWSQNSKIRGTCSGLH
jgi:hypothetical protein